MEWDSVLYPCKFKTPRLHQFNGKGSLNHHVYYFSSWTENIATNDALTIRFFIANLKGLSFDWFIKVQPRSNRTFSNLESIYKTTLESTTLEEVLTTLQNLGFDLSLPLLFFFTSFPLDLRKVVDDQSFA